MCVYAYVLLIFLIYTFEFSRYWFFFSSILNRKKRMNNFCRLFLHLRGGKFFSLLETCLFINIFFVSFHFLNFKFNSYSYSCRRFKTRIFFRSNERISLYVILFVAIILTVFSLRQNKTKKKYTKKRVFHECVYALNDFDQFN